MPVCQFALLDGDAGGFWIRARISLASQLASLLNQNGWCDIGQLARKEWHWVSHNLFDGVGKLNEGRGRVRFLSEDERSALLHETIKGPVLHTFVVLALSRAARAGELWNLKWPDVDLKEGRLLFRFMKNATPRSA